VVLDLVDDGLVLEDTAVVGEVNGLGLLGQDLDLAAGIIVALLERLKRGGSLAAEAEGGRNLGPVELESGAALFRVRREVLVSRCARVDSMSGVSVHVAHGNRLGETYSCHCDGRRDNVVEVERGWGRIRFAGRCRTGEFDSERFGCGWHVTTRHPTIGSEERKT
jgi:hypothetical protein